MVFRPVLLGQRQPIIFPIWAQECSQSSCQYVMSEQCHTSADPTWGFFPDLMTLPPQVIFFPLKRITSCDLFSSLFFCFLHDPSLVFTSCSLPFCLSISVHGNRWPISDWHFSIVSWLLTHPHVLSFVLSVDFILHHVLMESAACSLGSWPPLAHLASWVSPIIASLPAFSQGSWVVAGVSSKLTSCLCYKAALLTRPFWHWMSNVSLLQEQAAAAGSGPSLPAGNKGASYLCSSYWA